MFDFCFVSSKKSTIIRKKHLRTDSSSRAGVDHLPPILKPKISSVGLRDKLQRPYYLLGFLFATDKRIRQTVWGLNEYVQGRKEPINPTACIHLWELTQKEGSCLSIDVKKSVALIPINAKGLSVGGNTVRNEPSYEKPMKSRVYRFAIRGAKRREPTGDLASNHDSAEQNSRLPTSNNWFQYDGSTIAH